MRNYPVLEQNVKNALYYFVPCYGCGHHPLIKWHSVPVTWLTYYYVDCFNPNCLRFQAAEDLPFKDQPHNNVWAQKVWENVTNKRLFD